MNSDKEEGRSDARLDAALAGLPEAGPPAGLDQAVLARLKTELACSLKVSDLACALALLALPAVLLWVWQLLAGWQALATMTPSLDSVRQALPQGLLEACDEAGQVLSRSLAALDRLPSGARMLGALLGMLLTFCSGMVPAPRLKGRREL